MIICQEHYSPGLWEEMLPMLRANWQESTSYEPGLDVDPDVERYRALDHAGICVCVTARVKDRLVGYVVFIVSNSIHHKTLLVGRGDAFYMDPDYRGHGRKLLVEAERIMRDRGVMRLGWAVEKTSPLYDLLHSFGFEDDEIVMEKTL